MGESRRWDIGRVGCVVLLMLGGLGVGLLLPAVIKVREAAARSRCSSNFKWLAVASHNYADTSPRSALGVSLRRFPAGTVPNPDLPPERRLSWYVSLLPHTEDRAVFEQFDLAAAADGERNRVATTHRLPYLVCPSSGELDWNRQRWKSPTPVCHYVGVAGVGPDAATLSAGRPEAGVFGYDRWTFLSAAGMPDGTSNTLLLIETGQNPGHWAYGGPPTVRGFDPATAPYLGDGRPFGGFHSRVCNAVMADASTRAITNDIDPAILGALTTVGGREPLPADW